MGNECNECVGGNRSNILCGICIITILLGLGVTLIILGETLDIIDSTILGSIFLVFGAFVSTCIILLIMRPIYNKRKIDHSNEDLRSESLIRQQSTGYSQHGGSVYIKDHYMAGDQRPKTVSSVLVDVRPSTAGSKTADMFSANLGPSLSSSQASFATAPERNRDSLISDNEEIKSNMSRLDEDEHSFTEKVKRAVSFEEVNNQVTKF